MPKGKCPYREAEMSLNDGCLQPDFCCVMMNGKLHLEQSHVYYHQVQLQLYVVSDLCSWCDLHLVVYTTKDIGMKRIYPDENWIFMFCPQLDS